MAECIITRRTVSNKEIQWGDPVTVTYNTPSDVESFSSTLAIVKSTNYPFFKLTGFTRSKGESTYSILFTTTSTNMQSYFGNVQSYYLRGGNSSNVAETTANIWMQTTTNGQLALQWNKVNDNHWFRYGDDNAIYINRYKCTGKEWFYKAGIRAFMLA